MIFDDERGVINSEESNNLENGLNEGTAGHLLKRKDFLGVDEVASYHPNRTYYYKKQNLDFDEIIDTCSKKLEVFFLS